MRKLVLLLLVGVLSFGAANAQFGGFFNPIPPPGGKLSVSRYNLSLDTIVKSIRPVAVLSATVSDGAQLAGGAGFGYAVNKWDAASQAYITQWSVSAVGLLGTTGTKITGTGGIVVGIPGTNGVVGLGGGRDFTQGNWVLITSAIIKFN